MVTQERLKELFEYDPETGFFTRIHAPDGRSKVGSVIVVPNNHGYTYLTVDGVQYKQASLAFLYMTGVIPKMVDHINRDKLDNRWCNLREASWEVNNRNRGTHRNNKSGHKGVRQKGDKWEAWIGLNGKNNYIGRFDTVDAAVAARKEAESALW